MKRLIIIFLLAIILTSTAFAQIDLQPVATVHLTRSEPITVRQMRAQVETLVWQNIVGTQGRVPTAADITREVQNVNLEGRRQILDVMINERLTLQAAERDRITVTDNELNQLINEFRAQIAREIGRQPTEDEFALEIRNRTGLEMPAFREQIRRQAITERYLVHRKEALFNSITMPTDAEVLREYNISRSEFVQPETIRFDMIQVPFTDDASRTRARQLADQLSREIGTDPARFDAVSLRAHVPNSGFMAGDFGFLPLNAQAVQAAGDEFIDVAFNLRQGEVSRVITGAQSFFIIKITQNHAMRNLGIDDVILDNRGVFTVRQVITEALLERRQREVIAQATQELVMELRSEGTVNINENNLRNW